MMKARTSLWASMAIAASIGLAGCGGSSDNDDPTPAPESSTPTKTAMSGTISLSDAQSAALLAVLPDTGDSVELEGGGERAGVTFACTSADPCTITIENSAGTIVVTAHSTTAGTVAGTATGGEPEVSDAGAIALRDELLDTTSGTDDSDGTTDTNGLQVSHLDGNGAGAGLGTVVERRTALSEYAGFPTTGKELADPDKFEAGDAPVALQGWKGERWTNDGQTIVRYTDQNIETKTDGTFASRFGDREAGGGDNITNTTEGGEQSGGLDWKHAESADFPGASKSQSYVDGASFAGTFAGVDGKFSCAGNACELNRDKDGKLGDGIARGQGEDGGSENNVWTFTADDENAAVEYKDQDADYLAFGWWRDTSTGGTAIEDFKVLYSGRAAQRSDLDAVTGKATYNGHAAGNYVKGTEGGEFVADAKLEATFGGTPDNDAITGTISNFRDSSDEILGKWEVIAKAANSGDADIAGAGTFSINDPTGGAGGENWADGRMDGTFYGGTGAAHPTGVAGWFHATTNDNPGTGTGETPWAEDDVAVAGAFAATRHNRADVAAE